MGKARNYPCFFCVLLAKMFLKSAKHTNRDDAVETYCESRTRTALAVRGFVRSEKSVFVVCAFLGHLFYLKPLGILLIGFSNNITIIAQMVPLIST